MEDFTKKTLKFPSCKGRKVEAEFVEEQVSSDGGVLLLKEIDDKMFL